MPVLSRPRLVAHVAAVLAAVAPVVPGASASAAAATESLRVTVTTADGAQLPDACATVYGIVEQGWARVGDVCAEPGSSVIEISPEQLGSWSNVAVFVRTTARYVDAWVGGGTTVDDATVWHPGDEASITLRPAGVLSGRLALEDGRPADDAAVVVLDDDGAEVGFPSYVDQGRWQAKVAPGTYVLRYDLFGRSQYSGGVTYLGVATRYPVAVGEQVDIDEVFVDRGQVGTGVVTGTVTEAGTGVPLKGMCVITVDESWVPASAVAAMRRTTSTPRARGTGVPVDQPACPDDGVLSGDGGGYRVEAPIVPGFPRRVVVTDPAGAHVQWVSEPLTLTIGADVVQDVTLVRAGALSGRVVDRVSGRPLAGVCPQVFVKRSSITAGGAVTCSDADGWWGVSGLSAQRVTVELFPGLPHVQRYVPGVATSRTAALVSVRAGRVATMPLTRLPEGGVIAGTVTDRAGKPAKGVVVSVGSWSEMAGPDGPQDTTDAAGHYRIEGLGEGAEVVQFAGWDPRSRRWARQWSGGVGDPGAATPVQIAYDTTVTLDATLRVGATVEVTVTGANLPDDENYIFVGAYSATGVSLGSATWVTPGGGTSTIGSLPEGAVLLKAELRSGDRVQTWWYRAPAAPTSEQASPVVVRAGRTTPVAWTVSW